MITFFLKWFFLNDTERQFWKHSQPAKAKQVFFFFLNIWIKKKGGLKMLNQPTFHHFYKPLPLPPQKKTIKKIFKACKISFIWTSLKRIMTIQRKHIWLKKVINSIKEVLKHIWASNEIKNPIYICLYMLWVSTFRYFYKASPKWQFKKDLESAKCISSEHFKIKWVSEITDHINGFV